MQIMFQMWSIGFNFLSVLLWQRICESYLATLVQNSVCEDSEVSRSRLPIRLHYQKIIAPL